MFHDIRRQREAAHGRDGKKCLMALSLFYRWWEMVIREIREGIERAYCRSRTPY